MSVVAGHEEGRNFEDETAIDAARAGCDDERWHLPATALVLSASVED